jgi:hypothetical protein
VPGRITVSATATQVLPATEAVLHINIERLSCVTCCMQTAPAGYSLRDCGSCKPSASEAAHSVRLRELWTLQVLAQSSLRRKDIEMIRNLHTAPDPARVHCITHITATFRNLYRRASVVFFCHRLPEFNHTWYRAECDACFEKLSGKCLGVMTVSSPTLQCSPTAVARAKFVSTSF